MHRNHLAAVQQLIECKANVCEGYNDKSTPLLVAINRDSVEMVSLLLRNGADLSVFSRPAARKMLENSRSEIQRVVGRYTAWSHVKHLLFIYTSSQGKSPDLPMDLLRLTVSYLSPID